MLIALLLTSAPASEPARTLITRDPQPLVLREDCSTPNVDTDRDGLTPAQGDTDCRFVAPRKTWIPADIDLEACTASLCGPSWGEFRDGTSTEHEIVPQLDVWLSTDVLPGYVVGGGGDLPVGMVVLDVDPWRVEAAIHGEDLEVMGAMILPSWAVDVAAKVDLTVTHAHGVSFFSAKILDYDEVYAMQTGAIGAVPQ